MFLRHLLFRGLDVDEAMRLLLVHFSLPGESQQIERIITAFSEEFIRQNAGFLCLNSVYLISYSLMMLQTSAHNKNVTNKMTLQSFLSMTSAIKVNDTTPLQEHYLTKLYFSVTEYPLSVHHSIKRQTDM